MLVRGLALFFGITGAAANVWLAELLPLWETYLHYGGFPAIVAAAKAAHPIPRWFVDTLFDVVHKDAFASSSLDETQTAQLVERVWASVATPLNQSAAVPPTSAR